MLGTTRNDNLKRTSRMPFVLVNPGEGPKTVDNYLCLMDSLLDASCNGGMRNAGPRSGEAKCLPPRIRCWTDDATGSTSCMSTLHDAWCVADVLLCLKGHLTAWWNWKPWDEGYRLFSYFEVFTCSRSGASPRQRATGEVTGMENRRFGLQVSLRPRLTCI